MAERADHRPVADRLVCPNCPADYPTPFSRRYISCRRCGTEFLAPDEARREAERERDEGGLEPVRRTDEPTDARVGRRTAVGPDGRTDRRDDGRTPRFLRAIRTGVPAVAPAFTAVALSLWLLGLASFEVAAATALLVMNGVAVRERL
ncbi:hypothetical protein GWG54_01240 [Natronococcus sp. JC468]|uniref:hypothetical protein n=1 Tax=Natronococcus sp. JC468 TaxID=1961921 RepID=UPI00143B8D53|nr:hypothetical protein [Natronococcus sp. JC468]NKE34457.1 hypothetical protein [Natronococcus sp. JC468]